MHQHCRALLRVLERVWAINFRFHDGIFLQAGAALGGAMLLPGVMQAAWAAGSDKPEQSTVRVGFIPLTDCAPIAIASLKGFDKNMALPGTDQRGELGGGARQADRR